MGIWEPQVRVDSNRTLELNRGNTAYYAYTVPDTYPTPSAAVLTLYNDYGQVLDVWSGTVDGRTIIFDEPSEAADLIPTGSSWTLTAEMYGTTRLVAQGTVIRIEAPFPAAPTHSDHFDAVQYRYVFATPGRIVDPAWRILVGSPWVYNNSGQSLPNAVAAGNLWTGEFWPKVAMLYYAPLNTDAVRLTYNTVRSGDGEALIVICSNYDMSNYAAIYHKQQFGIGSWDNDVIAIVTGDGPHDYDIRAQEEWETQDLQNYTAEYNPVSNTFAVYLGNDTTPIVEWEDQNEIVNHGPGERYFGLCFESALLSPGVEISDVLIQDAV
ncbi:minor tail protein [Mycobacterium phage Kumao]|uniref:Minor tail protein n=1 Tax=Mycobacterium phage Kumao TaxID=2041344 RepID=A0A2D1GPV4_9CAUD|nr:minor tail protein [Mycobacterium phage Kumao]ATN93998.1 minor tail protein [Mycobacterium phage Kumao]